ncbi:MAG TPA: TMEM175 family protein [Thermoleophilia bacterium]|nr:TMEM175 family protein [Thermoleophilia bacterium]
MSEQSNGGTTVSRLLPTTRLEAFSDGVMAIAITLLVLELHVPTDPQGLLHELAAGWAGYLGYFVSFAFIGGVWIAHSHVTRFIKATDAPMLGLNLVLLLFVSFLPFTTSLLATHLDDAGRHIAVVIFGINLTLASLMVNVLVGYSARREGLAADDAAEDELEAFEKERRVALLLQAVATALGLLLPVVAVVIYLVVSVLIIADPLWRAQRRRRQAARARSRRD